MNGGRFMSLKIGKGMYWRPVRLIAVSQFLIDDCH